MRGVLGLVGSVTLLSGCFLFGLDEGPSCDVSDVEGVCDPTGVVVKGEPDGQTVDMLVPGNYGYRGPPHWGLGLYYEEAFITLWADGAYGGAPASGMFVLEPDGPIYCATGGCASGSAPNPMARLTDVRRLGTCPGPYPLEGEVTGCIGGDDCTVTAEPLFDGTREVLGYEWDLFPDRIAVVTDFPDGSSLDADTMRGGGTIVYQGEVYCFGDIEIDTHHPEIRYFTLTNLSAFDACEDAPAVDGSLQACIPGS